ncbi:MAG TPA: hypothetical protein VJ417_00185, partial [Candidatus Glassbacteria bacterium]|nr:hypothetical protein [Candidatus Glassbacteria bacterium]
MIWASGLARANPPAMPSLADLQGLSKAAQEENSPSRQRALVQFAKDSEGESPGALAYLSLGFQAFDQKQYSKSSNYFQAARATATPLQDYAEYYQALSEQHGKKHEAVVQILEGFAARYPSSRFAAAAVLRQAESLLEMNRSADAIALLLSPPVPLNPPEAQLLL